jgi:hypothetical protein
MPRENMTKLNKPGMRFALIEDKMIDQVRALESAGIKIVEIILHRNNGITYHWEGEVDRTEP